MRYCSNHKCEYCESNRLHSDRIREYAANDLMEEYLMDENLEAFEDEHLLDRAEREWMEDQSESLEDRYDTQFFSEGY